MNRDLRLEFVVKVLRADDSKVVALTQYINGASYVTTIFKVKDLKNLSEEELLNITKDLVSYSLTDL